MGCEITPLFQFVTSMCAGQKGTSCQCTWTSKSVPLVGLHCGQRGSWGVLQLCKCIFIDIFDIFLKNPQAVRDCCQRSPLKWKVGLNDGLLSAKGGGGGGFKMHLLSG